MAWILKKKSQTLGPCRTSQLLGQARAEPPSLFPRRCRRESQRESALRHDAYHARHSQGGRCRGGRPVAGKTFENDVGKDRLLKRRKNSH